MVNESVHYSGVVDMEAYSEERREEKCVDLVSNLFLYYQQGRNCQDGCNHLGIAVMLE